MVTRRAVSERALLARIGRALRKDGQAIRKNRSSTTDNIGGLGAYYVVDEQRGSIAATHVEIEALAREIGVMKSWEELATTA
jgi:hypothetical protein